MARVLRPRGRGGEMRLQVLTDHLPTLLSARRVFLGREAAEEREVERVWMHREVPVLKLRGVDDPAAAETLRGREVCLPREELRPLAEGEYFLHDLVGLAVLSPSGHPLGKVEGILESGAHPVLVVEGPRGEVLIPFIRDAVGEVDLAGGRLFLLPLPGLLEE